MISASAYVLRVPKGRRDLILDRAEENRYVGSGAPAEPVPMFPHSRRAPLLVLACFKDGAITHIAEGRKGSSGGTALVRLNLENLTTLTAPLRFTKLAKALPARFRPHFRRVADAGGLLPPRTVDAVVDAIALLEPDLSAHLVRFSQRRTQLIKALSPNARTNLAFQKETLGIALEIAGLPTKEILGWSPTAGERHSFLEGLPRVRVREDAMLLTDFSSVPGFNAIREASHYAAKTFESSENPGVRLTVFMANRLALEEQTGADLIYYNETYRSFVMVQYKAMEKEEEEAEFRWQANDKFTEEIARMDEILRELGKVPTDNDPDGYRFFSNPFFLKFCPRVVFNPDDRGLFKGIYLPLDLWKGLHTAGRLKGPKGGNVLSFANVGRRLNNDEFVGLVANAWAGTTTRQSAVLEEVVRAALQSGKSVTFAVKRIVPVKETAEAESPPAASFFGGSVS